MKSNLNLSVKTRGDSSPQGKPRVYFSCHPNDFKSCFEILTEEILETQNCAIYYDGEEMKKEDSDGTGGHDNGELRELLSGMQLFVVPITTNFLTKDSRARSFEYALAVDRHIPILPIAMEPGLDKLFAEIMNRLGPGYGDIQFLDRTLNDPTAIPYKEKLKTRLDAILVGDELAKRVRAAFDAYIFLSYRKKDRKYAQELMRLIHSIPYCRDIAIWYDEFLNPGEAWNDAIAEAMAKSMIVVLSVTPSLTEPGNFIIQHEYPEVVKRGKEILPAELLPTDMEALKRLFPEIPDVIDGTSIEAVGFVLRDELKKIGLTENDENPEHNYLIGLAYLGGIDVERDPQKAVELIKGAAERELPEAIKKLADMYHDGDGVARSYEEEIFWRKRYVENCEKGYKESPGMNFYNLLAAYRRLGDALYELSKLPDAKDVFEKMCKCAEKAYFDIPIARDDGTIRYIASGYYKLGNIERLSGDPESAQRFYINSIKLFNILIDKRGEGIGNIMGLARCCEGLGDIMLGFADDVDVKLLHMKKNIKKIREYAEKAYNWYMKGISRCRLAMKDKETKGELLMYSRLYVKLADVCMLGFVNDIDRVNDCEKRILSTVEKLNSEYGDTQAMAEVARGYLKIGEIAENVGNLKKAENFYENSLDIQKQIFDETNSIQAKYDLGMSYMRLAVIENDTQMLLKSEEIFEGLSVISEDVRFEDARLESVILQYMPRRYMPEKKRKGDK